MKKQRIGPYHVERLLGHGSSAAVYLGRHRETHKQVAIKLLHLFTPEEQAQATFRREVEVIQRLKHPGIVQILDVGIDEDTSCPYFTMSYASGGSLRLKHPRGEQVPLKIVLMYLQQLALALQYAHDNKVIHLDIKPENILAMSGDRLLLSDFGVARIIQTTQPQTTKDPGGTLVYKAPEQFRGKPRPASDQYALAITIYEWLCGKPPFEGPTHEHLLDQHLFTPPPPLREKNSNVTDKIEKMVLRALAKRPEERFPDIKAFAEEFSKALEEERPNGIYVPGNLINEIWKTQQGIENQINLCKQVLESDIDQSEARYRLGQLYQEQKRWEKAIQQFQAIIDDPRHRLSCYYRLGECYRARGELQEASECFEKALDEVNLDALTIEKSDQYIRLCQEAAEAHQALGEQKKALDIYNELLRFLQDRGWDTKVASVEFMLQEAKNLPTLMLPRQQLPPGNSGNRTRIPLIQTSPMPLGTNSVSQQPRAGFLRVEGGMEPGRVYNIGNGASIGRSPERDIVFKEVVISRFHASIVNMGNGNYALKDEGSTNGTELNGQVLNKHQAYLLVEGDRILLGETMLVFGKR